MARPGWAWRGGPILDGSSAIADAAASEPLWFCGRLAIHFICDDGDDVVGVDAYWADRDAVGAERVEFLVGVGRDAEMVAEDEENVVASTFDCDECFSQVRCRLIEDHDGR